MSEGVSIVRRWLESFLSSRNDFYEVNGQRVFAARDNDGKLMAYVIYKKVGKVGYKKFLVSPKAKLPRVQAAAQKLVES